MRTVERCPKLEVAWNIPKMIDVKGGKLTVSQVFAKGPWYETIKVINDKGEFDCYLGFAKIDEIGVTFIQESTPADDYLAILLGPWERELKHAMVRITAPDRSIFDDREAALAHVLEHHHCNGPLWQASGLHRA